MRGAAVRGAGFIAGAGIVSGNGFGRAGFGGDLYVGEAVVAVDGLQRADVGGDQGLAVDAVTVERIGGMNAQQFLEGCGVEVVISGDGDALHAAARAEVDTEDDDHLRRRRRIAARDSP